MDDLTKMSTELARRIDGAQNAVLLTQVDASRLKVELSKISLDKGKANVPESQMQQMEAILEAVNAHLSELLKLGESAISDLNKREVEIGTRIEFAARNDMIDTKTETTLRQRLDQITQDQSNFIGENTDGPLSSPQMQSLADALDQLQGQLDHWSKTPPKAPASAGLKPFTPATPPTTSTPAVPPVATPAQ